MAEAIRSIPGGHEARLDALGLKLDYFYEALRAGEQARRLVTKNDPVNAAGTQDYFGRVRVLREQLIEKEHWARGELDGLPLVVNPDRTMAIGVVLGDSKTGWAGLHHPHSKRAIGEAKIGLVAQNGQQQVLFRRPLVADEVDLEAEDLFKLKTWFFLTYRRQAKDRAVVVSSELSFPSAVSPTGRVERWDDRIPFPDLAFENVTPRNDDGGGEYVVEVGER
jgi:hypothetical protein